MATPKLHVFQVKICPVLLGQQQTYLGLSQTGILSPRQCAYAASIVPKRRPCFTTWGSSASYHDHISYVPYETTSPVHCRFCMQKLGSYETILQRPLEHVIDNVVRDGHISYLDLLSQRVPQRIATQPRHPLTTNPVPAPYHHLTNTPKPCNHPSQNSALHHDVAFTHTPNDT